MGQRISITKNEHLIVTLHETERSEIYRDFMDDSKNVGMYFYIKDKYLTKDYIVKFEIHKIYDPYLGLHVAGFDSFCNIDFGTYLYVVEAYNKITNDTIKVVATGHIDVMPDILLDTNNLVTLYSAPTFRDKKGEEYGRE